MISPAREDYLAVFFDLASAGQPVIAARVAEQLEVSPPAVTDMLRHLRQAGLVSSGVGQPIRLTETGLFAAAEVVRRHRVVECWLTSTLGLASTEVHSIAHRMEHTIPVDVAERLFVALGRPTACPHGDAIPAPRSNDRPEEQADAGADDEGSALAQPLGGDPEVWASVETVDGTCAAGHRIGDVFRLGGRLPVGICADALRALYPAAERLRIRLGMNEADQASDDVLCPEDGAVRFHLVCARGSPTASSKRPAG